MIRYTITVRYGDRTSSTTVQADTLSIEDGNLVFRAKNSVISCFNNRYWLRVERAHG